jgi:hypothetical protein
MTPSSISSTDLKKGSAGHWISFSFVSCCERLIHLKEICKKPVRNLQDLVLQTFEPAVLWPPGPVTLRVYHFKQSQVVCYFQKDLAEVQEDSL